MAQKHWTLQRIILIVLFVAFLGFKLLTDDLPEGFAIGAVLVGGIGTVLFFVITKKGIFAKKTSLRINSSKFFAQESCCPACRRHVGI